MDANKLKVLQAINYTIADTCNTCAHGKFQNATQWGVCRIFQYAHEKHIGPKRELSINKAGCCDAHKRNVQKTSTEFGTFYQFTSNGTKQKGK